MFCFLQADPFWLLRNIDVSPPFLHKSMFSSLAKGGTEGQYFCPWPTIDFLRLSRRPTHWLLRNIDALMSLPLSMSGLCWTLPYLPEFWLQRNMTCHRHFSRLLCPGCYAILTPLLACLCHLCCQASVLLHYRHWWKSIWLVRSASFTDRVFGLNSV